MGYTIRFSTLSKKNAEVHIAGGGEELTAGGSPLTITIDNDEYLYKPTRFSTAKLRIVTDKFFQDLFSTQYKQNPIEVIYDKSVVWKGFVKPEIYTQDYSNKVFELEVECISGMSVLEFIPYKRINDNGIASFKELIELCLREAGGYKAHYPTSYGDILTTKYMEDVFLRDDTTLLDALEEVCKVLGWTCTDWNGDVYFVDVDTNKPYTNGLANELNIQKVGFKGNDNTLEILNGYNKLVVRCEEDAPDSLVPQLDYNEDVIGTWSKTINDDYCEKVFVKSPNGITLYGGGNNDALGASLVKMRYGNKKDYESSFSETQAIQFRLRNTPQDLDQELKVATFESSGLRYLPKGKMVFSMRVREIYQFPDFERFEINGQLQGGDKQKKELKQRIIKSVKVDEEYLEMMPNVEDTPTAENTPFEISNPFGIIVKPVIKDGTGFRGTKNDVSPMIKTDIRGCVLEIKEPFIGKLSITMKYGMMGTGNKNKGDFPNWFDAIPSLDWNVKSRGLIGYFISDFTIKYLNDQGKEQTEEDGGETTYENVINGSYINPLDEIKLKLSTDDHDNVCYNKLLNGDAFLGKVSTEYMEDILEKVLITRIINRYSNTAIKLSQEINYTRELRPNTLLSDNTMVNKRFINVGGEIDLQMERFNCEMVCVR